MTPPAATAAARRASAPARTSAPARRPQRRVSGPAARPSRPVAVPRRSAPTLGARALGWAQALPDHRLLDRLIGGRVWIVLLGTLLVGIVTLQLTMLKLNAGIGRAIERSAALEQRNATLRSSISQLSDSGRIVAEGTRMGLVTPPQGAPRYVVADASDARTALRTMRVPAAVTPVIPAAETTDPAADPTTTTAPVDPTGATTEPVTTSETPIETTPTEPVTDTGAASATTPVASSTPPAGGAAAPTTGATE